MSAAPGRSEAVVHPGGQGDVGPVPGFRPVVLDTNIVLDLLVFRDPATQALASALADGQLVWHATVAMREELHRVLAYPAPQRWLARSGTAAQDVLAQFDRQSRRHADVPSGPPRCRDPDDQVFIDLALHLQALLLSKDQAVLRLRRTLAERGVTVDTALKPAA